MGKVRAKGRRYYARHKHQRSLYHKRWREMNKESVLVKGRAYAQSHRSQARKRHTKWRCQNREHVRQYARNQIKRKRLDLRFALRDRLRSRLNDALHHRRQSHSKAITLLGCSIADFIIYIESKFEPGMTWENWGKGEDKWNLDHIVPCAIFDLSKPEHQLRCFHFSNYQPLWQPENTRKGARVFSNQFQLL